MLFNKVMQDLSKIILKGYMYMKNCKHPFYILPYEHALQADTGYYSSYDALLVFS